MAVKVLMTALSPTMEQGTIVRWVKNEGDKVDASDVLCEVETDKAAMDYEAAENGTLLKILVAAGQSANVGEPIAIMGDALEDISGLLAQGGQPAEDAQKVGQRAPEVPTTGEPAQEAPKGEAVIASPLARKMAEQRSLNLTEVKGSGPGGRIIKRDIEKVAEVSANSAPDLSPSGADKPVSSVSALAQGPQRRPISGKRKVIAERLAASMFTAPHYYLTMAVEVDRLLAARKRLNAGREIGLSFNAFLIKLAAMALKRHPIINTSMGVGEIIYHPEIDIGLAVALDDGLVTPVVRLADQKGVQAIDLELKDLIDRATKGRLVPTEYTGATFTISNLGSFGVEQFTAIINPPGSAILAVGAAVKEPVVDDQERVVVKTRMKLTLSLDHRIIDGAVGAAFLRDLKELIEEPMGALL